MENNLVNTKIVKNLLKNQKIDWEVTFEIRWSIKWPDTFWNYLLKINGKEILLDKNLEELCPLEFIRIIPYDTRCYIGDLGWKCVFINKKTKQIVELADLDDKYKAKIFWKEKTTENKYFKNLYQNIRVLTNNESDKKLKLIFQPFLIKFLEEIKNEYRDNQQKLNEEIAKFWKACEKYFAYLLWSYKYMYNWEITKYLSWKSCKERDKLKNSKELKKKFPNLYLAMNELDDIENVIVNEKWDVLWYLKKIDWKYHYINKKWNTVLVYNDFKWPDKNWNIVTKKDDKYYFLNWNFEYPNFWFDEIIWPDEKWNYIWMFKEKTCLIIWNLWKIFKLDNEKCDEKYFEPNIKNECFKSIEWPDKNWNYILQTIWWFDSYLINEKWEIISKPYFKIKLDNETSTYNILNISWNLKLDKNWNIVK